MKTRLLCALGALLLTQTGIAAERLAVAGDDAGRRLSLRALESAPSGAGVVGAGEISSLQQAVVNAPKDRRARFAHVRALMKAGRLEEARVAAIDWRENDAYNLVVVRLLGDIYSELGETAKAMRVYSAVVELLPKDHKAQRALASVLKQSGQLQPALERLNAAVALRPDDARLRFEAADLVQRLGNQKLARSMFRDIAMDGESPELLRYPAKERLAQSYKALRKEAQRASNTDEVRRLDAEITALKLAGGTENDIKIYLTWDTDRSDVDLWVVNPAGEKVFYSHKKGKFGGRLFGDVTNGYGPESFTAAKAQRGEYKIQVNYFSGGSENFPEARGEVVVVLDEGGVNEERHVLPYRLHKKGQTVTVAKVIN
jgi:tetratricopeptide (TPR) repeat protein